MAITTVLPAVVEAPLFELRAWRPGDVDALGEAVARNLEHLRPWMSWVASEPLDRVARLELVEGWAREREAGGDVVYGVLRDGEVLGGTGLHRRPGPHGLEIGYWIDRDHTGRGIATEVARALTTVASAVDGIHFVEIHHDRANVASGRIPRRLGFTLVGEAASEVTAPGEEGIDCTWRVRTDEWRAGSSSEWTPALDDAGGR
jgi:RimJ/RimL family protein N-acetyltransferase